MPRHSLIFENRIPLLSHCAVFLRNYNSTKKQSWSSPPFSLFTTRKEKFFSKTVIIFVIALSVPKICKQFEHWNIYSLLQCIFSHVLKMTTPDVWCKTAMPHVKNYEKQCSVMCCIGLNKYDAVTLTCRKKYEACCRLCQKPSHTSLSFSQSVYCHINSV